MVKQNTQRLDAVFQALADPTRRGMLDQLSQGQTSVSQLAEPYAMSLAAASKHIKKLETAGLVTRQVIGRTHICMLNAAALKDAKNWVDRYAQFWSQRFDQLETALLADTDSYDSETEI